MGVLVSAWILVTTVAPAPEMDMLTETYRIVAFIVAFCGCLLFIFVPETFWDRTPVPRSRAPSRPNFFRRLSSKLPMHEKAKESAEAGEAATHPEPKPEKAHKDVHFAADSEVPAAKKDEEKTAGHHVQFSPDLSRNDASPLATRELQAISESNPQPNDGADALHISPEPLAATPETGSKSGSRSGSRSASRTPSMRSLHFPWSARETDAERQEHLANRNAYSSHWREREAKSFVQQLRPWHGRLNKDKWIKVAVRPFILFSYPSVLWSAAIYSCSIGWLIVVSESVTVIYREEYYHFDAFQTGLMYVSPFIGGVLGTAVAGKVSDVIVKAMARRNGGLYEPEFRLVMALPIAVTTVIGLMGYGWSAEMRDAWIVPTVFLGVISFGCSLGSTTAITFCVDSYRQYAGEALVTLNFSKNIFHGLVFSFFVPGWIEEDGSKSVFIWIGVIQLIFCFFSIPMFIFGKRARMWTVRKNLMEKF